MSAQLVIAVLYEAWDKFGGFAPERQPEIARWVQRRVNDVRDGKVVTPPTRLDREPGDDDA